MHGSDGRLPDADPPAAPGSSPRDAPDLPVPHLPELTRVLLGSMTEGVSLSTQDGIIVYTNEAEDCMFGYAPGELIGCHVSVQNAYPEDENGRIVTEVMAHLKQSGSWTGKWHNRRKDGTTFVTTSRISTVEIDGKPHWLCVQEDVTQADAAAAALEQNRARLELATEAAEIGIWDWDTATGKMTYSPRAKAICGFPPDREVTYDDVRAVTHPDDYPRTSATTLRALDPELRENATYKYRVVHPDGAIRWVLAHGHAVFETRDGETRAVRYVGTLQDISERVRLEEAERQHRARLDLAIEAGRMAVWELDLITDKVTGSVQLNRILGFPEGSSPTAEEIRACYYPGELERLRGSTAAGRARGERTFEQELRFRRPQGDLRWLWMRAELMPGDDGRTARAIGVIMDITERKEEEIKRRTLIELADRFRDLDDPAELAFAAAETLGRTLEVSRVGYGTVDPVSEMIAIDQEWNAPGISGLPGVLNFRDYGTYIDDLKRGETVVFDDAEIDPRTSATAAALKAISAQAVVTMPVSEKQGLVSLLYLNHATARHWTPGELELIREVAERTRWAMAGRKAEKELRDLNATLEQRVESRTAELRQTEHARREADALYRAYFEHTPDPLFVIGVEPDGGFTIEQINPAHEAGVGFKLDEVRGKRIEDILPAELADKVLAAYRYVCVTGEIHHYRDAFELGGEPQHWDTTLVPLRDADGTIVRLIGSSRNVTRQVVAEETLRQSQKMEAMGQLTGGVAHDFNNLLTPIVGSLDRLQRKGLGDEREQRLIAGAVQAADRAKTLVQRLLSFARRQPLQPVAVDVSKLVGEMAELISSTTGPQIKVLVDAPATLPPATADANQLEMALLNLSVNARDAMPNGGTLRISASAETVEPGDRTDLPPGRYVALSVADTGTGMDEQTLRRAVEPFFSTKGIGRGTGLGLSMVHGLAAQLGGALTLHSKPGLGTNVELWLPQSSSPLPTSEGESPAALSGGRRGRALLVDDDELGRASTADMLAELGYSVTEADSAEDALKLVERGLDVRLLVTDHLMPGMTGTELAHAMLTRNPATQVLIISGYAEVDGIAPELPRLTKPFRQGELAAKLDEAARHASVAPGHPHDGA